ncbi:MAG: hypothetical protein ACI3VQ_02410 [Faecousia sp.]
MYIRNFDPEWTYTIGKDGGINSYHNTTYDGHGGYSVQHHMEMEEIANAVLDKRLQELSNAIEAEAYNRAQADLLDAMQYDVESVVQVGLHNTGDIFHDKKTQKVIADALVKEVKKQLGKGKIKKNSCTIKQMLSRTVFTGRK